jgi:hypothetical protein
VVGPMGLRRSGRFSVMWATPALTKYCSSLYKGPERLADVLSVGFAAAVAVAGAAALL